MPIDLWNGPLEAVLKGNATRSIRGDSGGLEGKTDERIAQQLFLRRFNSVWAMKNCAVFGLNGYHCFIMTMVKSSPQKKNIHTIHCPRFCFICPPKGVHRKGRDQPLPRQWHELQQPIPRRCIGHEGNRLQDQCLRQLGKQAAGCLDALRGCWVIGLAKRFTS